MDSLHLCLIEEEKTHIDRTEFHRAKDPRRINRPAYILNKILQQLFDDILITSILDSDFSCSVPKNVDILMVHIDVSKINPKLISRAGKELNDFTRFSGVVLKSNKIEGKILNWKGPGKSSNWFRRRVLKSCRLSLSEGTSIWGEALCSEWMTMGTRRMFIAKTGPTPKRGNTNGIL
jgi:hypothetical protein